MTLVTRRERIFYAAGDTGFNLVWATIELYLLFYYVSVLQVPPYLAGLVFLVGSIVDLVADPLLGSWIDRREGRVSLRRWVALSAPLIGLALAATFAGPSMGLTGFAWLAGTYIVLRLTYSLGNIPYAALTVRMTGDADERIRITATRMQGAAMGGLIASAVFLLLPLEKNGQNVQAGAIILALASQPLLLASVAGVRERTHPRLQGLSSSALSFFAALRSTPRLSLLLAIIFFAGLSVSILHSSLLFLFDRLDGKNTGYGIVIVPALAMLTTAPLFGKLAIRIGEATTLLFAVPAFVASLALAAFMPPGLWLATTISLAIVFGVGMSTLFWMLVPRVIGEIEDKTASAAASKIVGLANLSRKTAQAVTPLAIAAVLSADTSFLPLICMLPAAIAGGAAWLFARSESRPQKSWGLR